MSPVTVGYGQVIETGVRHREPQQVRTILEIGDAIAVKDGKHKHIRPGTTGQPVRPLTTVQSRPRIPCQAVIMGAEPTMFDTSSGTSA